MVCKAAVPRTYANAAHYDDAEQPPRPLNRTTFLSVDARHIEKSLGSS